MPQAAYQLGLCYEIGFGLQRHPAESSSWMSIARASNISFPDIHTNLHNMDKNYSIGNPKRLFDLLGYRTSIPFDPVELYRVQGRLETAEKNLRMEIRGREQAMGRQSYSQLALMSILALVYAANSKLDQAESVCREAALTAKEVYGRDDYVTLEAQNYLAYILYRQTRFDELREMQLQLIETKKRIFGVNDGTTLNSMNYLGAAHFQLGRFDDCLEVMRELAKIRIGLIGPEHPETLISQTWITKALVKIGDLVEAERHHRNILAASVRALGAGAVATLEREEIMAGILSAREKLDRINFLAQES